MELEDIKLFDQISKKAGFHSALMTSFSIDFNHFEHQVLRSLRQRGISNVCLFIDERMLNDSLGYATGKLQYINSLYSVNAIFNKSVFHPKLSFFAGDNEVMLLQGSGNITSGGDGKNHEAFTVLYATAEDKKQLPLIVEAWNYLKKISENIKGFSQKKILWIEENCTLLTEDMETTHSFHTIDNNSQVALLYNDQNGIFSQVTKLIPSAEIQKITVVSPFYDESGAFLAALSNYFEHAKVKVFLSSHNAIHPYKMTDNSKISFFDWESTIRSQKKYKSYERVLHSKIIVFKGKEHTYHLIGSANATVAAFGTLQNRGVNEEFSVLQKTKKTDILGQLGLAGKLKKSVPRKLDAVENSLEVEHTKQNFKLKIIGADLNENVVQLYFKNNDDKEQAVLFFSNLNGETVFKQKIQIQDLTAKVDELPSKLKKVVSYVQVFNEADEPISNKYLLNQVTALWNTNPSKDNRRLQKLLASIEAGDFVGTQLIEFLNQIHSNKETNSSTHKQSSGNTIKDANLGKNIDSGVSYDEAVEIQNNSNNTHTISKKHNSIQIWEAIEFYLKNYALQNQDENDDEEEEGNATESRERSIKFSNDDIKSFKSQSVLQSKRNSIVRFFSNYCNTLERIKGNDSLSIGIIDLSMLLIVLYEVNAFTNQKVFLKDEKLNDVILPVEGALTDLDNYCGVVLSIIGKFTNIYANTDWIKYNDEYNILKLLQYKEICSLRSLFALALIKEHYGRFNKFHKWIDVAAYNCLNIFGVPTGQIEKKIGNLAEEITFENISITNLLDAVNFWLQTFTHKTFKKEIFFNKKTGFCIINKNIPVQNPKFLKLSRPGFDFNTVENDFTSSELFSIETETWKKSINSLR